MDKKNIVLIHGWGASTNKLKPLKKELAKLNWNVYIPKLPGFELKEPISLWGSDEYSDYIYKKSNNHFHSSNYVIFGHSFGGGLAIKLAAKNKKGVKGIVLCATRGISRGKLVKRILFYILAKCGKLLMLFPPLAKYFRKFLYKLAGEHDYEKTKGNMRDIFKKIISEDLKKYLPKINIPVLVLWGKDDGVTPLKDAKYIKRRVKLSSLVVYDKQKHSLPYYKTKDIAKDIDIWQNNFKLS